MLALFSILGNTDSVLSLAIILTELSTHPSSSYLLCKARRKRPSAPTVFGIRPCGRLTTSFVTSESSCPTHSFASAHAETSFDSYTMLLARDLPRYLGIRVLRKEAVMYLLTLATSPLPRPLNSLASRDDLRAWLTRLFLCIIWPGFCKARPENIRIPNNIVAFVCLLIQLHSIGYPGHWLGDFLQSVLANNLIATRNVWNGTLPRPVSDISECTAPHKKQLEPWTAELEAIVATSLQGLPFAIQMPPGLAADAKDIGHYMARIHEVPALKFLNPSQIDPVVSLIFYNAKRWSGSDVQKTMTKLPSLIDGRQDSPPGIFFVYTSPVFVNFLQSEVQWKMSNDRVQKMKSDGWAMLAWRSDLMANGK